MTTSTPVLDQHGVQERDINGIPLTWEILHERLANISPYVIPHGGQLTTDDVASHVGTSRSWVWRQVLFGSLPHTWHRFQPIVEWNAYQAWLDKTKTALTPEEASSFNWEKNAKRDARWAAKRAKRHG